MSPSPKEIFSKYLDKAIAESLSLAEEVRECKRCDLPGRGDFSPLPGSGYPLADIFLVKDFPNRLESEEGIPFFGEVGEALRRAFVTLELEVATLYGTNSIKCHITDRVSEQQIDACSEHLKLEIEIAEPRLILAMGSLAVSTLRRAIGQGDGELSFEPGELFRPRPDIQVLVTHDPEAALKKPRLKGELWRDLKRLKELCGK
ncbi:MAG: uracil-DNA glycosylase [Actinomycetota bacterium]|nr:uracil-DNA glycosylase [Actinomycetota bacterium]